MIYFNIFVHFYSFFSIAQRAIVKMDEVNKSLLLLLLSLLLVLLLSLLVLVLFLLLLVAVLLLGQRNKENDI